MNNLSKIIFTSIKSSLILCPDLYHTPHPGGAWVAVEVSNHPRAVNCYFLQLAVGCQVQQGAQQAVGLASVSNQEVLLPHSPAVPKATSSSGRLLNSSGHASFKQCRSRWQANPIPRVNICKSLSSRMVLIHHTKMVAWMRVEGWRVGVEKGRGEMKARRYPIFLQCEEGGGLLSKARQAVRACDDGLTPRV